MAALNLTAEAFRGDAKPSWWWPLPSARTLDGWTGLLDPMWALGQLRARVVALVDETADTRSIWLRPNRHWPGHRAGQHVAVQLDVNGVRCLRVYSISSAPRADGLFRLTVKRRPGGRLSNALHQQLQQGQVLELGTVGGGFGQWPSAPPRLLMLSAGSGITPMVALLLDLRDSAPNRQVTLLHSCRDTADFILAAELQQLQRDWPAFTLRSWYTCERGRLEGPALACALPDAAQTHTLLCGPAGFMAGVRAHYRALGAEPRLQCEHFGLAPASDDDAAGNDGALAQVHCARSDKTFSAQGGMALLPQVEAVGLQPRFGCRIGVCHSCSCRKTQGTVRNLLTGQLSSEPGERIRLCVSAACGDLELDL